MLLDQVTSDSATVCYLLNTRKKNNLSFGNTIWLGTKSEVAFHNPRATLHLYFSLNSLKTILRTHKNSMLKPIEFLEQIASKLLK